MPRKLPFTDMVDLHVHSSASDGVRRPREVVRHAADLGLKALALTDHDTVAGVAEAEAAGKELGVEVIPGVEISAEFEDGACHLCGYWIDPAEPHLAKVLATAQGGRDRRNREILGRLNDLGVALTMDEVVGQAGEEGTVTRAHFARAMLERGLVKSWDEAFDRYLARGAPAFVYRKRVGPEEAIVAIHHAGGLAVLAHPRQLNRSLAHTEETIARLAEAGLDGVETQSPDHSPTLGRHYHEIAERHGLLETGGTDWHGRADSQIRLGTGTGRVSVRYDVVEAMKVRLAVRRAGKNSA